MRIPRIHWGEPKNVFELRSWTGAISRHGGPKSHHYLTHEIVRWYGISFGRDRFLGVLIFGKTESYSSLEMPKVGLEDWAEKPDTLPLAGCTNDLLGAGRG